MQAIMLTTVEFIRKVSDFRDSSSGWHYQGMKPSIVFFYAPWCAHCKVLAPIFDLLASEYEGRIDLFKVDTEAESELASAFAITSIPTTMFIPMDGIPQMVQGALPIDELRRMIDDIIL